MEYETDNLFLRPTENDELSLIVQMEQSNQGFIKTYGIGHHLTILNKDNYEYFSIIENEPAKMIGFVLLAGRNNKNEIIELRRIVVSDKYKRSEHIIELIKKFCFRELKCHRLWLNVSSNNHKAIHLYQKTGFRKEGLIRDAVNGPNGYQSLTLMSVLDYECNEDYQIIRASTLEELDIIRALFTEYQKEIGADLCFQSFEEELDSLPGKYSYPDGELLLLKDLNENKYVGCVGVRKLEGNHCEMKRLFVKNGHRSKKYGYALANAILKTARQIGYSEIWLDTLTDLKAAITLYKKLGFEETDSYYNNPLDNVIYMKKILN